MQVLDAHFFKPMTPLECIADDDGDDDDEADDDDVKCQATWLYLEPIFSSEDIMAQMPEESRKFTIVDSYWRAIMVESVKDTNCLVVTDQPNMLNRLVEANNLLEEIQHGLNAYLEMKRLYFPRLVVANYNINQSINKSINLIF